MRAIKVGKLQLPEADTTRRFNPPVALFDEKPIALTARQLEILWRIAAARGNAVSSRELVDEGIVPNAGTLKVQVYKIRKAFTLAASPSPIYSINRKPGSDRPGKAGILGYALDLSVVGPPPTDPGPKPLA